MNNTMQFQKVEDVKIDPCADYLVATNGHEWRDSYLHVWSGNFVLNRMQPHIVRGRPIFVALIEDPISRGG